MSTYAALQQQIAELQKQAEEVRRQETAQVIADIKATMAQYGITVADLSSPAKRTGSVVKAKYRDPISGKEWSGRGIQPKWLREAVAAGRTREEFAVG
ncbi:H-NS family nucleoid-associated regulatory protein [Rhodocyclus tenuis]|uniref:H-NS histone family protein n=1 Tax=Rhodocyclus tenuis TaxID=1066 RepID=UPI0019069229|nr:H-NS histone family protein [Rhodocyclus tenuis]MBK1681388.1 endonuclease [Rhodocyclus tenuis]